MEAAASVYLFLYLGMARQAFHSADLLPHLMAVRTVIDPFELLVRANQLSRRKLGKSSMHPTP